MLASIREILGTGHLFGFPVLPESFPAWAAMGMPVGAFLGLGFLLAGINSITKRTS
jgi:electron transport complex protein RnfE